MKRAVYFAIAILLIATTVSAEIAAKHTPAPEGAELYFITPKAGETVSSPLRVRFGLRGMGVAPAGTTIANTGHHHLIIDAALPPLNKPIPANENYQHFGAGQTETEISLKPGKHTLQLLLADGFHVPHHPTVVSERIEITVSE